MARKLNQTDTKPVKKAKGFKNLLSKILVYIGIPVLCSYLIVGLILGAIISNSVEKISDTNLTSQSESVANQINVFFKEYEGMADQIADSAYLQEIMAQSTKRNTMDKHAEYDQMMQTVMNVRGDDPNILSIFMADVDAEQSVNTNGGNNKEYKTTERPWFIQMNQNNALTITEPYEDINTQKQVVTIAAPVRKNGSDEIEGAVGLDLTLDQLDTIIRSQKIGETGYLILATKEGLIISHPNGDYVGKNVSETDLSENIKQAILNQTTGNISFSAEGQAIHGNVSAIEGLNWVVTTALPDTEFYQEFRSIQFVILLTFILAIVFISIMIIGIARSIVSPIKALTHTANQIADGDLNVSAEITTKDETGRMAEAINRTVVQLNRYVAYISETARTLDTMANGDMRISLQENYVGEFAVIKTAFINISASLNSTLSEINRVANQVSIGADQVSSAAQALSSGSTEQAATVEELTAAIASVSQQAEQSTANVQKSVEYVEQAGKNIADGNEHMQRLNTSMREISETSQQISKITKLVEDIAFQTNILALNAAVEAARAGSAGKGFAVVADEVRNLAAKSGDAAKQTAELIEKSVVTVAQGEQIAADTLKRLIKASEKAELAVESIREIEAATSGQAFSIEQINEGLTQVSSVVQTNAATAEESSAASEELAAQAQTLQYEISKFELSDSQEHFIAREATGEVSPREGIEDSVNLMQDTGKY
ncbi:methyl-accepting chemotaxis protein [Scatolibacter rhodanostii]|uniref:methyl-accepting chemotaxis protein n=1 Tax=Scatolibacter rhodanostii TaxID=2014781 RepID=UPI00135657B2|nr:methyl-accepting chemotaxis protein [Scatolibacter rhodanostii]